MDLIAMRFEARHLEVEGKLQEALDVCRAILRHHAGVSPTEQLLPVFVQSAEIFIKLGDRESAAKLLLLAAEKYADVGMSGPVIELYRRLRRLGPGRRGLDLQFARRMLEQRHPNAAREFLTDLARQQKKEKLLAMLERMGGWHADKVQATLLDFLDRAQGIRVSTAQARPATPPARPSAQPSQTVTPAPPRSEKPTEVRPPPRSPDQPPPPAGLSDEVTEVRPAPRVPTVPAARPPAPTGQPPAPPPPSSERVTAPRRGVRPSADGPAGQSAPPTPAPDGTPPPTPAPQPPAPRAGDVMAADAVVFVQPGPAEPEPEPRRVSPRATRAPIVPPRRRPRHSALGRVGMVAALLVVVAGAVYVLPRLGSAPQPREIVAAEPGAVETSAELPSADPDPSAVVPESTTAAAAASPADSTDSTSSHPVEAAAPAVTAPSPIVRRDPPVTATPPAAMQPVRVSQPVTPPGRSPADTVRPAAATPSPPPVSTPAPAGARGDYPVVVVEGLEIAEISREGEPPAQRIVVKQLLSTGDTLDLRESDLGEQNASVGAGRLLVRRHPAGGSMGTVRVGRFLVNARAPIEPEVLEPLLRRLVERE